MEGLREVIAFHSQSRPIQIIIWIEVLSVSLVVLSASSLYSWKVTAALLVAPVAFRTYKFLRYRLVHWRRWFQIGRLDWGQDQDFQLRLVDPVSQDIQSGGEVEMETQLDGENVVEELARSHRVLRCCILLPHSGGWYDVASNKDYPCSASNLQDLVCNGPNNFVCVPVGQSSPDKLVPRLQFRDECCVYFCNHNPLANVTSLLTVSSMINKADGTIMFIVVLPAINLITNALEAPRRIGYPSIEYGSSPIVSYADWHGWLQQLTSGIFGDLLLVLPYADTQDLRCMTRTICTWEMTEIRIGEQGTSS